MNIAIILCGVFCIFCAYKDYDWFMNNYKARPLVKLLGRNGARVFYIIIGIMFVLCGIFIKV
ncbi:Immunity protein 17 [Ruminococcus sp. YE71]|uniref:Imm17 family immunity protein n=1 Tax=unclassified Ruminococcus TaxID=2608920 RepID=UPI00087FF385|nr:MULTISPECIES: Imm17 family immunity protein [unclassified Ruminococcus]SDA21152.1 Immunity protein 17 [Ruminococcus sp. YE78]SFW32976.1 Immunity protein 17 [Ruminococcus sp. YE71]